MAKQTSGARLAAQKDIILSLWLDRVRAQVPDARDQSRIFLLDSFPQFLDRLIAQLHQGRADSDVNDDNVISVEHGRRRAKVFRPTPAQLFTEYRLLENLIFECLEGAGPVSPSDRQIITNSIHTGMTEAVTAFISTIENEREEADSIFRLLVTEVKDYAIFALDPSGIVMNWNEGAERIKGYTAQEAIGQFFGILYLQEDADEGRPAKNLELARLDGRHQEQWWRRRKDGSSFWADVTITALYDRRGRHVGFTKVIKDLTAKKLADEELRAAKEAAEAASEMKSAFLANMSHEIRTPLGAILGFTEMLSEPNISDEERDHHREVISRNGQVLLRLIEDILDLSKIESGKLTFQYAELPVRDQLPEMVGVLEQKAREKGLRMDFHISANVPQVFVSDPIRVRQIVNNLVGNAIKFTTKGTVRVTVDYRGKAGEGHLEILVEDTGTGIPVELRDKLFKPFAQADDSSTRRFGGTGLGLALSRRLARELGGDISIVDCPVNEGCTFLISLADQPRDKIHNPKQHEATHARNAPTASNPLDDKRILLVEDSKDNQVLISRLLAKAGGRVEVANDGAEGVQRATTESFDLVLMDIQMPVLDGLAATRKLRSSGFAKPIIALTAHAMNEHRELCASAGCTDHLTKPINAKELLEKVKSFVNPQRERPPRERAAP